MYHEVIMEYNENQEVTKKTDVDFKITVELVII